MFLLSTARDYKNTARITIYMGKLRQFQSMTAYEFVHHHLINDESKKRTVSCIYSSTADFGPLRLDLPIIFVRPVFF